MTTDQALSHESAEFAAAIRAVVYAEPNLLSELISANPDLAHQRSKSNHQCTLLHYVAANGIEDALQLDERSVYQRAIVASTEEKQRLLSRIEKIVAILLHAGAQPDAESRTYGGGPCETTLNLLCSSAHPFQAGFTRRLVELLLASDKKASDKKTGSSGAAPRGKRNDDSPLLTALSFGIWPAAVAIAKHLAPDLPNIFYASVHPNLNFLRERMKGSNSPEQSSTADDAPFEIGDLSCKHIEWLKLPETNRGMTELAMIFSAMAGNCDAVDLFLDAGIDIDARPTGHPMPGTALQTATYHDQTEVIKMLTQRKLKNSD